MCLVGYRDRSQFWKVGCEKKLIFVLTQKKRAPRFDVFFFHPAAIYVRGLIFDKFLCLEGWGVKAGTEAGLSFEKSDVISWWLITFIFLKSFVCNKSSELLCLMCLLCESSSVRRIWNIQGTFFSKKDQVTRFIKQSFKV